MFSRWALATTLVLGVLAMFVDQRHRQLVVAAAAAHERANGLDKLLQAVRARSQASLAEARRMCTAGAGAAAAASASPPPSDASVLTLDAIREVAQYEMRQALLHASTQEGGIAAAVAAAEAEAAAAAAAGGVGAAQSATGRARASELNLARVALGEALAAEQPGWCRCPPPPNLTEVCASLLMAPSSMADADGGDGRTTAVTCEQRVLRARSEVDALRSAVLEANARSQEASAASILKAARAASRSAR